jgi:hypothetical protein
MCDFIFKFIKKKKDSMKTKLITEDELKKHNDKEIKQDKKIDEEVSSNVSTEVRFNFR